jgi:hypothetical protein
MEGVRERPPHSPRTHTSPKRPLPGLVENVQSTTWEILESPAAPTQFVYLIVRVQRRASLRICVMRFCKQPRFVLGTNTKTRRERFIDHGWLVSPARDVGVGDCLANFAVGPCSLGVACQAALCLSHSDRSLTQHTDFKFERHTYTFKKKRTKIPFQKENKKVWKFNLDVTVGGFRFWFRVQFQLLFRHFFIPLIFGSRFIDS